MKSPRSPTTATSKEELKGEEEVPIIIHDYTNANAWEKLISNIEEKLVQWNIASPNNNGIIHIPVNSETVGNGTKYAEALTYADEKLQLTYISSPKAIAPAFKSRHKPFIKYYSEGHCNLMLSAKFPSLPPDHSLIPLYFGVTQFLCLEIINLSNFYSVDLWFAKSVLSALQIAAQRAFLQLPVFVLVRDSPSEMPKIYGYLSHFAMCTNFYTERHSGIHNISVTYPTLSSLLAQYLPERLLNKEASFNVSARYTHNVTYSNYSLHSWFTGNYSSESVSLSAKKDKFIDETPTTDRVIWGKFVSEADEVTVETKITTTKVEKFSSKVARCVRLFEMYQKLGIPTKVYDLGSYDYIPLKELEIFQAATQERWRDKNIDTETYANVMLHLQNLKPCSLYSFYAALLKKVYSSKDEGYIQRLWHTFTKSLRSQWEAYRTFPMLASFFTKE